MPGPIVELSVHPLMYLPLATEGFALMTLVITTVAFSTNLSGVNEILPTGTCTRAVLSVRNSTLPAFTSCTAFATSKVTVPVFGLGMRPLGPSTLPRRPTDFMTSGVAIRASKSVQFSFWIFSTISSPPTKSAPAASASFTFSPVAMTRTFFDFPRPCGRTTVPRTIWSACLGSTPRRIVTSTVSSNFAYLTFCRSGTASCSGYGFSPTAARALVMFLPGFLIYLLRLPPLNVVSKSRGVFDQLNLSSSAEPRTCFSVPHIRPLAARSLYHINPHRPRGALHAVDGRFERRRIQIGHLLLRNVFHLLQRHFADLVFIRRARSEEHTSEL